jgi:hypothetical protein
MPDSPVSLAPVVYQLRVVLRAISPLIWRRLLVPATDHRRLHRTLQVAFGWSDEHLHRFVIHGRLQGTESLVGPRRVRLADLGLRVRERLLYEYDFIDGWQHDGRLEQILPLDSRRRYPVCIGGRRAAPPEGFGGPWAFLELRQRYLTVRAALRVLELVSPLVADSHDDVDAVDRGDTRAYDADADDDHDRAEELGALLRWLRIDRFDRRAVNRQLAQLDVTPV